MASIPLSTSAVDAMKNLLRQIYDERKSSHLTEGLAAALGFNSHAALLVELKKHKGFPKYQLLDEKRFDLRMQAFGYSADPEFDFEDFKSLETISTVCGGAYEIEYNSPRKKAWRNLVICAVNEALSRRLFSLRPGDNRWPGYDPKEREPYLFNFNLPCGLPGKVSIHDAGFDELSIHVAVNPKGDSVRASNAGFHAGDAFASTWLERRKGAWVQSSDSSFHCRKKLVTELAEISVDPFGYGDRGRIIM